MKVVYARTPFPTTVEKTLFLRSLGARQLAPTILSHRAHAFVVELTAQEFEALPLDQVLGAGAGELTRVEVRTVRELLEDSSVDWGTLGMILRSVSAR